MSQIDTREEPDALYRFRNVCGWCGKVFYSKTTKARWHTPACKQAAYRHRLEEKKPA